MLRRVCTLTDGSPRIVGCSICLRCLFVCYNCQLTSMAVPAELYESLRKRVAVFSHRSKRIYDGDAEALHRTRIASRRLRELFPVLRIDAPATRKLDRRLRRVTKQLGTVRDVDVLMSLIDSLHRERGYSKSALQAIKAAVEQKRTVAREKLEA